MNEGKLREEAERGEQARQVVENPAYGRAWTTMREELVGLWLRSETGATESRERTYLAVRLLDRLKGELEKTMRDGKSAANELARMVEAKRRKGILGL